MINVECPSCSAPYELDERRLPPSGMNMRCPKCGESFRVTKDGVSDAAAKKPPLAPAFPGADDLDLPAPKTSGAGLGGGADLPAPKRPGPPPPPPPPAAGGMDLDLPAPKRPGGRPPPPPPPAPSAGGGVDLPAPKKRPLAPPFEADLPAPKAAPSLGGGADLPAPKKAAAAPGGFDLDLPAPKKKKPIAPPVPDLDADLPAPKTSRGRGGDDLGLDLPAPKKSATGGGGLDLDLPAPKSSSSGGGGFDLDLPAPKSSGSSSGGLDLDLPAPKSSSSGGLDLDLPAPKSSSSGGLDLDLPAPKSAGGGGGLDLDLPAPKSSGGGGLDLDLPAPRAAGSAGGGLDLDLPAPKVGGGSSDLPAPKVGGAMDLDLPMPKVGGGGADLPAPRAGGGIADLPMPTVGSAKNAPPTGGGTPFDAFDDDGGGGGGGFGELDLGSASAGFDSEPPMPNLDPPSGGGGLGGDLDLGGGGLDLGGDLELGAPPSSDDMDLGAPLDLGGGLDDGGDDFDDLALPEPRDRGEDANAGGMAYGDVDLGGDFDDGGLEFDGIPEGGDGGHYGDIDAGRVSRDQMVAAAKERKRRQKGDGDDEDAPKRSFKGLIAFALVLLALVGAGAGLSQTSYGLFGVYAIEQYLPEAGNPPQVAATISSAEALFLDDTYASARRALRTLAEFRRNNGLNRRLLARSLMHESLFIARYGDRMNGSRRASDISARLMERGDDAPGIDVARAANAIRNNDRDRAAQRAQQAISDNPSDPWGYITLGEAQLMRGDAAAAANAFRQGIEREGGARAQWGLARALLADSEASAVDVDAAIAATLEASPGHIEARIAQSQRHDEAHWDDAIRLAREAAGMTRVDNQRLQGTPTARARAFTLLGRLYADRGRRSMAREMFERATVLAPEDVEALVGAGHALLAEDRAREALAKFTAFLEQEIPYEEIPAAPEGHRHFLEQAQLGAAQALLALERPQDARGMLQPLHDYRPTDAEACYWMGRIAEATEGHEEATNLYRQAIQNDPTRYDSYLALSQLYMARDRPDDAAAVLASAEGHVEMTAEVRRLRGLSEVQRGNLQNALTEFRAAIALDEHDILSRFELGVTLRRLGRLTAAGEALDAVAAIDPSFSGLALERGRLFEAAGNPQRAVDSYRRALEADSENLDLVLRLGAAQIVAGQVDEADATLRRVLEARPRSAEALHFVGRVAFARGDIPGALRNFDRAVQLDSSAAIYHAYVGWAAFVSNELGRALSSAEAALQREPELARALWVRAQVRIRAGQARLGLDDLIRAVRSDPSLDDAWAAMGQAYDELGDTRQAIEAYRRAVNSQPRQGEWWYRLGRLELDAGREREAAVSLSRATVAGTGVTPRPSWLASAHRAQGDAHRALRQRAAAVEHYRAYLEIAPPSAMDRHEVERALLDLGARP